MIDSFALVSVGSLGDKDMNFLVYVAYVIAPHFNIIIIIHKILF